ncbi:MAG: DUF2723 domain-containing protein [Actinomycetota bacterium]|nr:DUF2723 domain-containing protein [Actinomycetota bacterium]
MKNLSRDGLKKTMTKAKALLERYYRTVPIYRLSGRDKLTALSLTLFFFLLYLYTCSHGVNIAGDSPEIIATSYSLGIVHQPGYPLCTMIGYLFSHIPIGSVAFRVNFLSVLFHSLALLFLFLALLKMVRRPTVAAIAVSALGFSHLFWFYSQIAEVFPFNDFFAVLLIFVAVMVRERWVGGDTRGSRRLFLLLAFLCGLSLTNHHTILLIYPGLLLFTIYPLLSVIKRPKFLLLSLLLFILGLTPYIYLPLRAAQNPYLNFGDPSTFSSFISSATRSYYGSATLWRGPTASHRLDLVFDFFNNLGLQVYLYGMVLGAIGVFRAARKRFGDFLPLLTAFFFAGIVFPLMANVRLRGIFDVSTIERFYLLPTIIFVYFIGFGAAAVVDWVKGLISSLRAREDLKRGLSWVVVLLVALPFLLPTWTKSAEVNLKYDVLGEVYIDDLVSSVEEGSLIFVQGDVPIELMGYYETVVEDRKEVILLTYSFLLNGWYIDTVRKYYPDLKLPTKDEIPEFTTDYSLALTSWLVNYIMQNNPQIPSFHILTRVPEIRRTNVMIPWGITFKLPLPGEEIDMDDYYASQVEYWKGFDSSGLDVSFYTDNRREVEVTSFISQYPRETGAFIAENLDPQQALYYYSLAYDIAPAADYLKEIADLYLQMGQPAKAYPYLQAYVDAGSTYDPDVWRALIDLENILAGTGGGDGQ